MSTQRTNEEWLADLRGSSEAQAAALSDLHQIILKALPYALAAHLPADHPGHYPLVEEIAQETLLRVLDRLDTFEGRSQFTTWVHKIAIRLAYSELRKRRWRDVSLEDKLENEAIPGMAEPADSSGIPETLIERDDLFLHINRMILEELTEKQYLALQAVAMQGMPLEEVARRMDMQRNALYKLLHDARKRLKQRLKEEGLTPGAVMAAFERVDR
jgi:RNA polymerase sigma-70 factor, ECF subfamily